ncbi:MAG: DNA-processing protein DprA [Rickettsiales bacterium]|nr:DNA-processing protein DprA [Rickettsiales bacterium]
MSGSKDRVDRLRIAMARGIGPVAFDRLMSRFPAPSEAVDFLENERNIRLPARREIEDELDKAARGNIAVLLKTDAGYPSLLKQVRDAPPLLYVMGNVAALNERQVAVVGSRNASINSAAFARTLAQGLADRGFVITSGLALGIDAAAHAGALASVREGAKTIAVLACGVDRVYPPQNRELYGKILRTGGAVVGETPVGAGPQAALFPRRNRIISGLSQGVVVVEAGVKSGSLITARQAAAQGREVFAVPGFPLDPRGLGTNALIKEGAALVETADDVADVLNMQRTFAAKEPRLNLRVAEPCAQEYDGLGASIMARLDARPTDLDDLEQALPGYGRRQIASALLDLELDGKIAYPSNGSVVAKI